MAEPLRRRRELLRERLTPVPGVLAFAEGVEVATANATQALTSALLDSVERETEGLMLKLLDGEASAYEAGKRSFNWLKLKKDYIDELGDSVDLVPVGGYMGGGRRAGGFGAYLLAAYDDATARYQPVCKIGAGFTDDDLAALSAALGRPTSPTRRRRRRPTARSRVDRCVNAGDAAAKLPAGRVAAAAGGLGGARHMLSVSPVFRAAADLVDENGKGSRLRFPASSARATTRRRPTRRRARSSPTSSSRSRAPCRRRRRRARAAAAAAAARAD